jgi:hypothetical protein
MKAFVLACLATVAISVGANFALQEMGFSTEAQTTSPANVRLD